MGQDNSFGRPVRGTILENVSRLDPTTGALHQQLKIAADPLKSESEGIPYRSTTFSSAVLPDKNGLCHCYQTITETVSILRGDMVEVNSISYTPRL